MYITVNEIESVLSNYNITGSKIVITEYFPCYSDMIVRVPIEDDGRVHPSFTELYNRNYILTQNGRMIPSRAKIGYDIGIDGYEVALKKAVANIKLNFPNINIETEDISRMYSLWVKTGTKYQITGIMNVNNDKENIIMSNFKDFWIPEFDIGVRLSKTQFITIVKKFIPELSRNILMADALYKYAVDNIMHNDSSIIYNAVYNPEEIIGYITQIVNSRDLANAGESIKERLLNIIESPINIDSLRYYYTIMGQQGFDPRVAKALLTYHESVFAQTRLKVRSSFGLPDDTTDWMLVLPIDMYLDINLSKETMVVSIM